MKPPREELRKLYEDELMSTRQLAAKFGVTPSAVKYWLRKYDIPRRPAKPHFSHWGGVEPTAEELQRLVHVDHLPVRDIAKHYGISTGSVGNYLRRFNIERPAIWTTRRKGFVPELPDKPTLERLYFQDGHSQTTVGEMYGVSAIVIARLFRDFGLTARPPGFDGGKRYECTDGHIVRSTYEQRVDDWLFDNDIAHEYEPQLPFDRRHKADFLANGWYIEVWGVYGNVRYRERRDLKRSLYREHGLPFLQTNADAFSSRRNTWRKHLEPCLEPAPEKSPPLTLFHDQ